MHQEASQCSPDEEPLTDRKTGSGTHRVRILIVDDSVSFRTALDRFLSSESSVELVGVACDGLEALDKVQELKPDLVIMDSIMPVMGGVEATRMITARFPGMLVIGLSFVDTHAVREAMLNAGAADFFGKIEAIDQLIPAIQRHIAARNRRESKGCT